jgi:hypothetical protein
MTLMTLMLLTLLTCARSHPRPPLAVGQHSEESNHDMSSVERRPQEGPSHGDSHLGVLLTSLRATDMLRERLRNINVARMR